MTAPSRNTAHDEAVEWLIRVQSDQARADDWMALATWLEASPEHAEAFAAVEALDDAIDRRAADIRAAWLDPPERTRTLRLRRRAWVNLTGGLLAASIVAALLGGPILWRSITGAPAAIQTAAGANRTVHLADGTQIDLDGATTLTTRQGWFERRVNFAAGEARFDVAKDTHRPFRIFLGDQEVRVVGTEFDIRRSAAFVQVAVRRGVVSVLPASGGAPIARLTPGLALTHEIGSGRSKVRAENPDDAMAWRQGQLVYENESLGRIAEDINRHYPMPLRVSDAVAGKRFSGVLQLGPQEALVRRLAGYLSLTATFKDDGVYLR